MLFLAYNNTNFQFGAKKLTWRSYTIEKTLSTTSRIELVNKHKFTKVVLDENSETFIVYVAALEVLELVEIVIHSSQLAQVLSEAQLAAL